MSRDVPPRGLAINNTGNLFIADSGNHRIVVYTSDGEFLPMGITFLPNGQLAVVNYKQQSICTLDVGESVVPRETSPSQRPDPMDPPKTAFD